MARADVCLPVGLEAAGDKLSAKEVDEVIRQLRKRQKELRASETIVNDQDAAVAAAEQIAAETELAAVIAKRNEAINLSARTNLYQYVSQQWGDRPVDGLEARLVGVQRARAGARLSTAAEQKALRRVYMGGLINGLRRAGVLEVFSSGALDRDASKALENISKPEVLKGLNPDAVKIARVVNEWQERARVEANKAGAWIGKVDGYITRQGHDARKIEKAGFTTWRDAILPRLDLAKTFPDLTDAKELDDVLKDVWKGLSTGVHLTAQTGASMPGFKGPANLAKKLSHERVLHFKEGQWFDYNVQFGTGNLREAVVFGLGKIADTTALMKNLGINPRANLEAVIDKLQRSNDANLTKFNDGTKRLLLDAMLGNLDGTANRPADQQWARFWANTRAVQSMAKLGGATLSSVTDLATYAAEMRYQGKGMLSGIAEAVGGLRGRRDPVSQEILASLGVFFDSISGEFVSRFSADDSLSGGMSRAMRQFFKLNAMSWWTESLQATAGLSISNHLAQHADRAFLNLPDDIRRVLNLYGLDAPRWDLLRAAELREHNGRSFMTPEGLSTVPDERFAAYLKSQNQPTTGKAVERLREELATQLRSYVSDRVDYAVIQPDAKTRAYMLGEHVPGTFAGELRRMIAQFKAFPIAMVQRTLGREILGRGADTVGQGLRGRNGELLGLANVLVATTLFGYAAMVLKDIAKGRTPRDPTDPKTMGAAMLQGGAWGIYGDFLLGESNRFGRSALETVAGPVLGTISDIDQIRAAAMAGEDVGAKTVRAITANTPYLNLFYTRMAVDYLFLYQVQEYLNPGSIRRMEKQVQKQNNQSFIYPPSEAVD